MPNKPSTQGELLFERYLLSMGYEYEFEKEFPGKPKRADYTVLRNGTFLFDVKDFDTKNPTARFGTFDPYPPLREKINQGRAQFQEFKEYPCSLVLRNNGNPEVPVEDPHIVLGAMYGDSGYTFPVSTVTGAAAGPNRARFPRKRQNDSAELEQTAEYHH
jgi:hypothetical protein